MLLSKQSTRDKKKKTIEKVGTFALRHENRFITSRDICRYYKSLRDHDSAFLSPFSGEGATVIGRPESGFIRHPHQPS